MKLCRKSGVSTMEVNGIKFTLAPEQISRPHVEAPDLSQYMAPEANIPVPRFTGEITPPEAPKTDMLTEDQLLMWSAQNTEPEV